MTFLNSFQYSIFQILSDDSTLLSQLNGIYDRTPQGADFSYLCIGDCEISDWSSRTHEGVGGILTLVVWSREGGRKHAAIAMQRVYQLLHDTEPEVSGYKVVLLRHVKSHTRLESDGWTYRGEISFRVLAQQTE
jgi:hypothetical protein